MVEKEILAGGRVGKIFREDDIVRRPANKWTIHIHQFLNYLHENGVSFVPKPIGITEQNDELITYMPGDVFNYPLPKKLLSEEALISSAKLLYKFHEVSKTYVSKLTMDEQWMLPSVEPIEVMCHGDFAPYNVTTNNGIAIGIIDFDTLHPGSKMWDIVYGLYRFVPLSWDANTEANFTLQEKIKRTALFLDTYGINADARKNTVKLLISRLQALMSFMQAEAANGNEDFQRNIKDGHMQIYIDDISLLKKHEHEIILGIS